ncbi:hypothetical protein N7535_001820 [Penicillium sp. DV-2018c]|nr:hypothetical protein N7535_001820 [Penicillium sp. DV-2018c]
MEPNGFPSPVFHFLHRQEATGLTLALGSRVCIYFLVLKDMFAVCVRNSADRAIWNYAAQCHY